MGTSVHLPELRKGGEAALGCGPLEDPGVQVRVRAALALTARGQVLSGSPLRHLHHPLFISVSSILRQEVLPGSGVGYPASPPLEAKPLTCRVGSLTGSNLRPPAPAAVWAGVWENDCWPPHGPPASHNHGGALVTPLIKPWIRITLGTKPQCL